MINDWYRKIYDVINMLLKCMFSILFKKVAVDCML